MKTLNVVVPPLKNLIVPCPGFQKKKLADYKIDLLALCQYLLHEGRIIAEHVRGFGDLTGVLLQGNTEDGRSRNPAFADAQQRLAKRRIQAVT